ncbi:1-acyl-sn-glycerol-3-phosphate acyltransferase [Flexivirga sp. ID2601S]|uniref:1-acyl-sn-glycerol-3-phosphate acyltransferase n=1 Tax=Flexivirga aerilata TaxID=1656889 RepID=A0A849ACZ9_9MICO|nr:lysophospholipid acyltransferase family protein [Flexivirga aerilata]NNG38744.1 1-acyl-sn-glycerol-3-phosphate acyltransferase [Flexivirga aerilata]
MSSIASVLRRGLWRAVCSLAGGLTTSGVPQRCSGGQVIVANHASHADTAALLAAVPAANRLLFAAAADYWFDVWWRRALMSGLAGGLPVRRNGGSGYAALLDAARGPLADGRTVVIYPEGTRSTDGSVGRFHSGAVRLAQDCGVPIVPVALLGTGDVLAKHGRLRTTPMEVRFGARLDPSTTDADQLREAVIGLLGQGPVAQPTSPAQRAVAHLVDGNRAIAVGFAWGFAEAISWPIMAEMALVFFGVADARRIPVLAASTAAGSVCGVALTAALARRGILPPAPLTTPRMRAAARDHLRGGAAGIWHQALGGVPVKVYARAAGELRLPTARFVAATAAERSARMAGCAALIMLLERPPRPVIRRFYGTYLAATGTVFTAALRRLVRH